MSSEIKHSQAAAGNGSIDAVFEALSYAKANSPFYQRMLSGIELSQETFQLDALKELPFTSKDDISGNNTDFLGVPMNEVAEFCTTSGTSGNPITVYLTKHDLSNLALNEVRSLSLTGANSEDIFQLMTTIDKQFMAGLAYYLGVQELNAGMIRIGPGVPALQWKSIFLNKPTVLIAVPSFIVTLIDFAKKNGIDHRSSSVRSIICIGEAIREDDLSLNVLGKRIQDEWAVELYSTYASTEMGAAFTECTERRGCHLNSDLLYLEVLEEDGKDAQDGEIGEVVITTLNRKGTPLIRYRTEDLVRVHRGACPCGDHSLRIGPVIGRKNQMIKFKGTTLFPSAIFDILNGFRQITCYKLEISRDEFGNDVITILLEKEIEFSGTMAKLIEACRSRLRVVPNFVFLENDYLRSQVYKSGIRKPEKIVFK